MIRSMTGFGAAAEQVDDVGYAVEVRSVNNRYFKALIRLPEEIAGLEAEIDSQLRKIIQRGSVTYTVKIKLPEKPANRINDGALKTYLEHLQSVHASVEAYDHGTHIDLTALLALPGVLEPDSQDIDLIEQARPIIRKLTVQACEKLTAMRDAEGAALAEELRVHRQAIQKHLAEIADRAPHVVEEYHQRLRSRIDDLLARAELKIDEHDLIREVAIFAERSDIREETARLAGHMDQFEQILDAEPGSVNGRTLDFLAQEMLREANTIASKSNDALISRAIVEVKGAIDRIKEQAQNVE